MKMLRTSERPRGFGVPVAELNNKPLWREKQQEEMFRLARYAIKEKACDCLGWNENAILDEDESRAKYPTPEDAIDAICNWAMNDGCIDPRIPAEKVLAATHFYGYKRARRSAAFRILKLGADYMAADNNWPLDWKDALRARYNIKTV